MRHLGLIPRRTRRQAIREGIAALAALGTPARAWAVQKTETCPWAFDIDGDGVVSEGDRAAIASAAFAVRGSRIRPHSRWDPRLDFLSQGRLSDADLEAFDRRAPAVGTRLPPRPITACWHYGWYGPGRRARETPTVRYVGGNYLSSDRHTEEGFNALKEEFGISADILSWINDRTLLRAFERGYFSAANHDRRRFGLLYESQINLAARGRISMGPDRRSATRLRQDFHQMGRWLREVAGARARNVLRVDERPVVYLYGSHTFGINDAGLPDVGAALIAAREAFAESFGSPPYLIGDESIFPGDAHVAFDRRYRAQYFDAVTRYHHYDERWTRGLGDGRAVRLDAAHVERVVALEQRNIDGFAGTRNRFTDRHVSVIPSAAAGFAKRGLPSLRASRADYEALLDAMQEIAETGRALRRRQRLRSASDDATLIFLGSWNEEFEGHAVMPATRNGALATGRYAGFDWLHAIKSRYGVVPPHQLP